MKRGTLVIVLLLLCAVIAVVPLALISDSEFGGADGEAEEVILEIAPEYEPWAESILEPPGGETESLLFCLQAALGAGIIGLGFGYLMARTNTNAKRHKPTETGIFHKVPVDFILGG